MPVECIADLVVCPVARLAGCLHPVLVASRDMSTIVSDPAAISPLTAQSRLGALKSRRVPDDDPRVVECRQVLAYWRCRRVIDAEAAGLSPRGRQLLVSELQAVTL